VADSSERNDTSGPNSKARMLGSPEVFRSVTTSWSARRASKVAKAMMKKASQSAPKAAEIWERRFMRVALILWVATASEVSAPLDSRFLGRRLRRSSPGRALPFPAGPRDAQSVAGPTEASTGRKRWVPDKLVMENLPFYKQRCQRGAFESAG
jgi:hypothetical protein